MPLHELVLLNPYRYPGQHSLVLGAEDMACWMNGFSALWHPALLWQAKGPPRCDSAYDHEQPQPGFIYAVPETPPLYMPDDWEERVRAAGSLAFKATTDRAATLDNLKAALAVAGAKAPGWSAGLDRSLDEIQPFFGVGLGHLLQATLAEAMEHENLLENDAFWEQIQHAVALLAGFPFTPSAPPPRPSSDQSPSYAAYDYSVSRSNPPDYQEYPGPPEGAPHQPDNVPLEQIPDTDYGDGQPPAPPRPEDETLVESAASAEERAAASTATAEASPPAAAEPALSFRDVLKSAAERLLSAREVLYPVAIHLLDLVVLDEKTLDQPWPPSFPAGNPVNVLASAALLEKLSAEHPEKWAELRQRVQDGQVEVIGGQYAEREDPYLPLDSQLWNIRRGLEVAHELLGQEVRVFGRRRFGYHPQLPLLLTTNGIQRALFLTFDETSGLPHYTSCVVAWPSPDGKQVDAFVRAPLHAHDPQTFFNLGNSWYKTTREDHTATLCLSHTGQPPCAWYGDLMELARLAPMFGQWTTFSRYFETVMPGEHPSAPGADDFHSDYLGERVEAHRTDPVSAFARHVRQRRRVDACWTYAALHHALGGGDQLSPLLPRLRDLENTLENAAPSSPAAAPELDVLEQQITILLADRLQSRSQPNQPGYLLLNPCAFARRVALELEGGAWPLPIQDPVKACQLNGSTLRAVVEVPALGFAWIPRQGPAGTQPMTARIRVADQSSLTLRNEFFEVELDPTTGGLKAIRDHKTRVNRLGQRLVFNPGSRMVVKDIQTTLAGPALGEMVASGELLGEQDQVLAKFKQRFRVWMGRPMLEIRIDLQPVQPPAGYPWHAYFGSRFAWRDERGLLLRAVSGTGYLTTHPRPQSPDFLEIRLARQGTVILPGGLPFHQRHEGRMLDVILVPEGEQTTTFDLGIALDRDMPQQTALGLVSPLAVVPTTKGPPHAGASAWLFHLDAPNLLLTRMIPGALEPEKGDAARSAVTARLFECGGYSGHAEFRCVRNPTRAAILDARGGFLLSASPSGDAVLLEITPNDLVHLQVEFD